MQATDQTSQTKMRVQSVEQLALLVDARFKQLKTMIECLVAQMQSTNGDRSTSQSNGQETVNNLITALRRTVDCLSTQLDHPHHSALSDREVLQDIARALALSGNGEKFEFAVESAIRNYCDARNDISRYSRVTELSAELRDDIVAGFTRVMEQHRRELQLLGVEIEDVSEGLAFDPQIHQIVKQVEAPHPMSANTIRHCHSPIFRWKNGQGQLRFKPAKVVVYTPQVRSGHRPGNQHT